ncbi:metallophosphoesterase [uncultured Victivallis sp.]|uniref:metallophosphoesterase family protein n=1 Tax=uncultured Victivallis sp. TaxID=354118 RepID=UPI00258D9AAD|nr:metallophosphoesterase [uncultured Victivallis sp.]
MKIKTIAFDIGLKKPLRLLHLSDTHYSFADKRDDERKQVLATLRTGYFDGYGGSIKYFEEAVAYGKQHCDLIVHTGDLIDFISAPNLEVLEHSCREKDFFLVVGNHEFSLYVGETKEDAAYKQQSFDVIQQRVGYNIDFTSRIVNGVNLVAIDNSYYLFSASHLEFLEAELAKKLPIILLVHVPLHTDELFYEITGKQKHSCAWLCGTPEKMLSTYSSTLYEQQCPDETTLEFICCVKQSPLIKAVLAGHIHFPFQTWVTPQLPQYIAGGNYAGFVNVLEIF